MKAGLSVLINNDYSKIDESAKRYLEYSTIKLNSDANKPLVDEFT